MMSNIASLVCIGSLLPQSFARANVKNRDGEKQSGSDNENDVKHGFGCLLPRLLAAALPLHFAAG